MKVLGIDFTSAPSQRKPITCMECEFDGEVLRASKLMKFTTFTEFEAALLQPGPWIGGADFPFGLARKFVETIGWPGAWQEYVLHASGLGRSGFRNALNGYRQGRAFGDREHRRLADIATSAISPQKLYGVPVALMFFEGAARIIASGVTVPHLLVGDPSRIVVEAYPGTAARSLVGRLSYKQDTRAKQTVAQRDARRLILDSVRGTAARNLYGFDVEAPNELCDDPTGDQLDALLCAVQAAWAWTKRGSGFGAPSVVDPLEGWIADPSAHG